MNYFLQGLFFQSYEEKHRQAKVAQQRCFEVLLKSVFIEIRAGGSVAPSYHLSKLV